MAMMTTQGVAWDENKWNGGVTSKRNHARHELDLYKNGKLDLTTVDLVEHLSEFYRDNIKILAEVKELKQYRKRNRLEKR